MLATLAAITAFNFAVSIYARRRIAPDTPVPIEWNYSGVPVCFSPAKRGLFYSPLISAVVLLLNILAMPDHDKTFVMSCGLALLMLLMNIFLVRTTFGHHLRNKRWLVCMIGIGVLAFALDWVTFNAQQ